MEYRRLGRSGLKVSELCLGTMTFGWTSGEREANEVFDAAWAAGINLYDTADVYSRWAPGNPGGVAETYLGNWLRGKPREQVVLATKVRGRMWDGPNGEGLSRAHIMRAVEDSLRRLQTDYIDLYQCHHPDPAAPVEETLGALDDLVRAGKVRYIGLSNYPAWQVEHCQRVCERHNLSSIVSIQPHYNLIWRSEYERELMPLCAQEGIGVIPYSPLQGGFLTGKYRRGQEIPRGSRGEGNSRMTQFMANEHAHQVVDALEETGRAHGKTILQTALAWLLANPTITSPIIGVNTVPQLNEMLGAAGYRLTQDEKDRLDHVSASF